MDLIELGWNNTFEQGFNQLREGNWVPARIFSEDKGSYILMSELGELTGRISGKYRYLTKNRADFPAVGDWVVIEALTNEGIGIIHALLPRSTVFSRKAAGSKIEEQVIAANIDTVFIIFGLDNNFNLRGIERYVALVWNSGAQPVIILNKADLISNEDELTKIRHEVESVVFGVPVHFISAATRSGMAELEKYFSLGRTIALVGSSGVGKSTLTNTFLDKFQQKIGSIRENYSKGRHTTTRRSIFILPTSSMIIDMPGMRELQLWMEEKDLDTGFSDIESLSTNCHFRDCKHNDEPGCAVQEAILQGYLDSNRLKSYHKMLRELQYLASCQQQNLWDSRLEDRKFGKERHNLLKHQRKT